MRILHISNNDSIGGAARGCNRLHSGLVAAGHDSIIMVNEKFGDDNSVIYPYSRFDQLLNFIRNKLDNLLLKKYIYRMDLPLSVGWAPWSPLVRRINEYKADIVHIHWLGNSYLGFADVVKINAPIVITMHDNWLFTGICHIKQNCDRFVIGCGKCPQLGSKVENDLSKKSYLRKKKIIKKLSQIKYVAVSQWLASEARRGGMIPSRDISVIANPLDTTLYRPFQRNQVRKLWNFTGGKKIILFGAFMATRDPNKGYRELIEALGYIKNQNVELVIFGCNDRYSIPFFRYQTHYVGYIRDEISLMSLYNCADVVVVPSLQESFGQTASEAISCGVPVVAFGATGLLDIIDHKVNGYLARPYEPRDLADGIDWVLNHKDYAGLKRNSREKAVTRFDVKIISNQYINLYQKLISFH